MLYIFESEVPDNKSIPFCLNYVFGIGNYNSQKICKKLGFCDNLKLKNLSKDQINKLISIIESMNLNLGNELKKSKLIKLKRLTMIKSYKGLRKIQGLPVRGQRTHTNAKTVKKKNY